MAGRRSQTSQIERFIARRVVPVSGSSCQTRRSRGLIQQPTKLNTQGNRSSDSEPFLTHILQGSERPWERA